MTRFSDEDTDRVQAKPRKGGKIPHPPGRDAPLTEVRHWLSEVSGLPPEVRIEAVVRTGTKPEDPVTIVLSNQLKLRADAQATLQQPRTLQAWLASETEGIALPHYLGPAEVGDYYTQVCRLGHATAHPDPVGDLAERLEMFVAICEEVHGSIHHAGRYVTVEALKMRPTFDRGAADSMRKDQPEARPVLLVDTVDARRYVRASEWVTYLRVVHGWKVNESTLPARMSELGSQRIDPEAWNADRSRKVRLVFYIVPEDAPGDA